MGAELGCKLNVFLHFPPLTSPDRQLLTKSKVGVRVCIGLLDNMVCLHEAEEGTDAAKAFDFG